MSRSSTDRCRRAPLSRPGFTLIEILIAVTLMLMMMVLVASIFALMSDAIEGARAMIETTDRLRAARNKLQTDLAGIETPVIPPRRPSDMGGYFEYVEGPMGVCVPTEFGGVDPQIIVARLNREGVGLDTTLGDMDDVLMFTTRSRGTPFVGKFRTQTSGGGFADKTIESQVAEVAWFLRGTTLYRRQLLVVPGVKTRPDGLVTGQSLIMVNPWPAATPFYKYSDLSVHQIYGPLLDAKNPKGVNDAYLVANSLGDLTNRQNRFAHQPYSYPYDVRFWGRLGLPTLSECSGETAVGEQTLPFPYISALNQPFLVDDFVPEVYPQLSSSVGLQFRTTGGSLGVPGYRVLNVDDEGRFTYDTTYNSLLMFDAWTNPQPWRVFDRGTSKAYSLANNNTGAICTSATQDLPMGAKFTAAPSGAAGYESATRVSEDVILTNVLSFDVKIWDDGAPVLMDSPGNVYQPGDSGYLTQMINGGFTIVRYGAYVDLNYMCLLDQDNDGVIDYLAANPNPRPQFADAGNPRSRLVGTAPFKKDFSDATSWPLFKDMQAAVYDTWSTDYEHDGLDQDGQLGADQATNGIDDNNNGQVDDVTELEAPPPYAAQARGIQIKIRVYEPDTQQIREVTIEQDFMPE